jgi:hypothetical protein
MGWIFMTPILHKYSWTIFLHSKHIYSPESTKNVGSNINNDSTFNVEMKRKTHQRQKHRSGIWDAIFTYPSSSQHTAKECLTHRFFAYPIHPPIQDATVIQTNLKVPSSVPSPCNPQNRKEWTAKERRKASNAKDAKARGFLNEVCASSNNSQQLLALILFFPAERIS